MHVVLPDQNRLRFRHQALALVGPSHADGRSARGEALQDDPVDLRRRGGRHDRLLDEAGCAATAALMRCCHSANASSLPDRTRVCVTMVTALARLRRAHDAEPVEDALRRQRQAGEAHAGRVGDGIDDGRRHAIDGAFALRLGAERPDLVVGVGEIDLAPRHVGEGWDAVVAERRVQHGALRVIDHLLVERPAEAHGDSAVELAAALHRVDQPADVGGVHALQGHDLAGDAMHGDAHALHVEPDRARRQIGLASYARSDRRPWRLPHGARRASSSGWRR